ncbi:hypothetical protein HCC36_16065 [Listeria booriae]|uniref:Uncharacterized protein n=1 Tax=Listeria booriae TaxID=1552123 RepID=A0A842G388_9LIST|nr:hypothetical protein [Listeria booriae]MBC2294739.1 hypothetical protein [Listeria booriae]
MYGTKLNVELESQKALEAFLQAHNRDFVEMEEKWNQLVYNCRNFEIKASLQNLAHTGKFTANCLKDEMEEKINRFLYIYFKNKPHSYSEEVKMVCKEFVKINVFRKIDVIYR